MLINTWDVGCMYPEQPGECLEDPDEVGLIELVARALFGGAASYLCLPRLRPDGEIALAAVPAADRRLYASMTLSSLDSIDLYAIRAACLDFRRRLREDSDWPKGRTEFWALNSRLVPLIGKGIEVPGVRL